MSEPVGWMDKFGAPRSMGAPMRDNFRAWLYTSDELDRKDAAIAEMVGVLRPFANIRFSEEDCLRASVAIAKYDHD